VLSGHVSLTGEALIDNVKQFVVDTKDITVSRVAEKNAADLLFTLSPAHPVFGNALHIDLKKSLKKGEKVTVDIHYHTSPEATAIQWLEPSQTVGKKHPYVFTQCQAIHARSMLPCQDAPSVKATYDASVTVPKPLTAVMSAVPAATDDGANNTRVFKFKQEVPMSSYLIALGIGELEYREIGPRTRVWSEKEVVDAGAYEFAETESFLKVGEELMGPYVWGRYDILLLPPSFPYGGMENPCLTFVTPTLLAGDRSNADVVAHEIAHSWTGNLVTNKTWEHFWLNEGMTVYTERKIVGKLHGEEMRHFKAIIGLKDLKDSVDLFGPTHDFTCLIPQLKDMDPDDAFSSVPYEKGFNFLFYLETLIGGPEKFQAFLKTYIDKFKFSTVTSEEFKAYFLQYFSSLDKSVLNQIDWDTWFHKPGMPPVPNNFDQKLANISAALANKWIAGGADTSATDIKDWNAQQIVVFLDKLLLAEPAISDRKLIEKMESLYHFTSSKNSEIRSRWYRLCIQAEYDPILPHALGFLREQGRMKFTRPLYRALHKSKFGKDAAVKQFTEYRNTYHAICAKMVAKDLGV